jgi:iron transport multicopper oxidase
MPQGLLLQTNPEGITADRLLFSVIVGMLTTSIVAFTGYLFCRELFWQLLAALREVDEEEAAEELEWELADEAALLAAEALDAHDPTVGLTPPGPPTPGGRTTLWFAILIALSLGLGLGLSRDPVVNIATVHVDAVSRFTLVIARQALPGSDKLQVTVNGSVPGPPLHVPVGNRVQVTVINEIFDDATAVHWHGMQQRGTPYMDGVVGVTQCPISNAPGFNTMVYDFLPDRAGTFWYHGHYNGQYPDGLYGALIIDDNGATFAAAAGGNASYGYDNDAWVWFPSDWYDSPAHALLPVFMSPESGGDEPLPDAIIVNNVRSGGELSFKTKRGTRQLVRVINAAAWSMWTVSVDGMPLLLVELDGTAVEPVYVPYVELNVAQRASFILDFSLIHADVADSPSVWFRMQAMTSMYPSYRSNADDYADHNLHGTVSGLPFITEWTGLIYFDGSDAVPSYQAAPELTLEKPKEVNMMSARSYPPMPAPNATHTMYMEMTMHDDEDGVHRWYVNGETVKMVSGDELLSPSLEAYASAEGGELSNEVLPTSGALTGTAATPFLAPFNAVIDVLVNNTHRGEHPFHMHGHDLWIVDSSGEPNGEALYGPHYVRRDVVSVSAGGWARMRFVADNPGIWVFHCHTDWHMHAGMMTTIIEAPAELQRRAADGTLVTSPSHVTACEAPQTIMAVLRSAHQHAHGGGR